MGKPHKHAELIKAWADGAQIQVQTVDGNWKDSDNPWWENDTEYRIKPNTININGFEVPEPLRSVEKGQKVYRIYGCYGPLCASSTVSDPSYWDYQLRMGILHASEENALLHAKALLSLTTLKD